MQWPYFGGFSRFLGRRCSGCSNCIEGSWFVNTLCHHISLAISLGQPHTEGWETCVRSAMSRGSPYLDDRRDRIACATECQVLHHRITKQARMMRDDRQESHANMFFFFIEALSVSMSPFLRRAR